jgi:hypothetical protein
MDSGLSQEGNDWLMKMGLWDCNQGSTAMKIRYERFKGIKFGVIPVE